MIDRVASDAFPELVGWSPWKFAASDLTEQRLRSVGFPEIRCWLRDRPTYPEDVTQFIRTSILAAHLERLPEARREEFVETVAAGVCLPLDYVRLNVSARRGPA